MGEGEEVIIYHRHLEVNPVETSPHWGNTKIEHLVALYGAALGSSWIQDPGKPVHFARILGEVGQALMGGRRVAPDLQQAFEIMSSMVISAPPERQPCW